MKSETGAASPANGPERPAKWNWVALGAVGLALAVIPPAFQACGFNYGIMIACFIMLYSIAVSGLDISFGYCGQISMGHAGFFAIGAYGSALLSQYADLPVPAAMLAASALSAAIGALLAWPASKLRFHFLSLATIAFGEVVFQVISHSPGKITGNFTGLFVATTSILGYNLDTYAKYYYFTLFWTALFLLAKTTIINSRIGRSFMAIRENHHAADGMGINVRGYKVTAFAAGAFYTAFAGALYVHLVRYISPDTIMQKQSVLFLTMLLFGGSGSFLGPILGAGVLLVLNESIRSAERYQMLIYGAMLLVIILAIPGGIHGSIRNAIRRGKKGDSLVGR